MKTITSLFAAIITFTSLVVGAQTNVYFPTSFIGDPPHSFQQCSTTGTRKFFENGHGVWKPDTNATWYWPTTNTVSISFSNNLDLMQLVRQDGLVVCGTNALSVTDTNWQAPFHLYRFALYWPTNFAFPGTNAPVPITAVNLITNHP